MIFRKYVSYIEEIAAKLQRAKYHSASGAGILSHYAASMILSDANYNPTLPYQRG